MRETNLRLSVLAAVVFSGFALVAIAGAAKQASRPPITMVVAGDVAGASGDDLRSISADPPVRETSRANDGLLPEATATGGRFWDKPLLFGTTVMAGDRIIEVPGPDDEVRVIVELVDQPVLVYARRTLNTVPGRLTLAQVSALQTYRNKLAAVRRQFVARLARQGIQMNINYEYEDLFNGLALTIKMRHWQDLTRLPEVRAVYPDYDAQAALTASIPLIGASDVWKINDERGVPVTGAGIRVAIIDSGVDYTHLDLGGCAIIGPNCKVVAGYDIWNDDSDPFDDWGHGTHVAGIVAANGALTGVAPDARLLAYKVLNHFGAGTASSVVAGIERAANPDGDPTTDDAAHVMNLSIAIFGGTPGDPPGQAVENAVDLGIIVVVAAGNRGPFSETIGTPGLASKALTVAASDKSDVLAPFSSRGPIPGYWHVIKPDISAPGVAITSTVPISGTSGVPARYLNISGTSMAAPHVAGAAALIKQLHPDWTPAMVKASLMNTARDIGAGAYEQGSGRIDVEAAARTPAIFQPASLGLGLDDLTQQVWTVTLPLTLTNVINVAAAFTLTIESDLPSGITTTLSITQTTLSANESREIVFTIDVDNATVLSRSDPSSAYEGRIVARSGSKTVAVPFAFFKSPELRIDFGDEKPLFVMAHDAGDSVESNTAPSSLWSRLLPAGNYDVIVDYFPDTANGVRHTVIKEQVPVTATSSLAIRKSDAIHEVILRTFDVESNEVVGWNGVVIAVVQTNYANPVSVSWYGSGETRTWRHFFSDVSSKYILEARVSARNANTKGDYYEFFFQHPDGIAANLVLENDPAGFRSVEYQYHMRPGINQIDREMRAGSTGGTFRLFDVREISPPFVERAYQMPVPNAVWLYNKLDVYSTADRQLMFATPLLHFKDLKTVDAYRSGVDGVARVLTTSSSNLPFGLSPPHWFGKLSNSDSAISIGPARGKVARVFLNQMQDLSPHTNLPYELYLNGNHAISGTLTDLGNHLVSPEGFGIPIGVPGAYTLTVTYDQYYVWARQGQSRATLGFDTTRGDKDPPYLLSLNVFVGDRIVNTIGPSTATAEVRFELEDELSPISGVSLEYRINEGAWRDLSLNHADPVSNSYTATLQALPAGSYVAFRINADDGQGNWLAYEADPAMYVVATVSLPIVSRGFAGSW